LKDSTIGDRTKLARRHCRASSAGFAGATDSRGRFGRGAEPPFRVNEVISKAMDFIEDHVDGYVTDVQVEIL
jgi:hypothetical protein